MKVYKLVTILLSIVLLSGCGKKGSMPPAEAATSAVSTTAATEAAAVATEPPTTIEPSLEAAALIEAPPPAVPVVLQPMATGTARDTGAYSAIDYSHTEDGYVMAKYNVPCDARLKVLVKGPSTTYSYNLTPEQWTVFPLSDGNGGYQVGIYENITGSKYALVQSVSFHVELLDEFAPFLRPNQYVNYTDAVQATQLGVELTWGIEDPLEKVAAVYDYVVRNLTYDYDKAATVKSGYLPDIDQVLEAKTGICFDYAALMTAMLRSQEIPCKLVVGYAGSVYHAWISVWTAENGWIDGAIFFDGQVWTRMDPTFASSGGRSDEIMNFINGGNYTTKYLY